MGSEAGIASSSEFFPAVLRLAGRRTLVVGGGAVALRKTRDLLRCGALVHVVARHWPARFEPLMGNPRLRRSTRAFRPGDLAGIVLAIATTDDRPTQELVAAEAERRGVLLNVVDVPDLCGAIVPATLRRGSLLVSVSTEGKCPAFAVRLRDRLGGMLSSQLGPGLERLAAGRRLVRRLSPDDRARRVEALDGLLQPASMDALMEGRLEDLEAQWKSWEESLWAG